MCLGTSEKELTFLRYAALDKRRESHVRNLVEKCLRNHNHYPQFLCTILNITGEVLPRRKKQCLT